MAKLDRKFYKGGIVSPDFPNIISKAVSDGTLPSNTIPLLNSLINGKSPYKSDLEDVIKKDDFEKGITNTSAHGILTQIVKLGMNIQKLKGSTENVLLDSLISINDNIYLAHNDVDGSKNINYQGVFPSVNDTRKLKQIEFKYGNNYTLKFNDDFFKAVLNTDGVTGRYVAAIKKGDTSLSDDFSSDVGILYTLYKNIKRRSDSVKHSLNTVKGSFKGDNSNLYSIKKIDRIMSDELQDRKTILNVTGQIQQLVKGAVVTMPEFTINNKNFLYYKRNTFDLFIDEDRRMSFQFLSYKNPTSIGIGESYKIECRIESDVYKDCEIFITALGLKEKQISSSAFPVVDAYNEFTTIFNKYVEIRDAYLSSH